MDESKLLNIALTVSVLGLISLFVLSSQFKPEQVLFDKLDSTENTDIKISGVVSDVSISEKLVYLEVAQLSSVKVLVFKPRDFNLAKGEFVEISGELSDFKGKNQIVANKIKVLE